jgi:8-oxo-dGTP diphosphatase
VEGELSFSEGTCMECKIHQLNSLESYKYVVIIAVYCDKWVFCKHKERDTWETAGGHIEPGETPMEAAKRELFEETGAVLFDIKPVFDYWASDDTSWANGMVFFAEIKEFHDLPESEMEKVEFFIKMPSSLTYKDITPKLLSYFEENFRQF